MPTEAPQIDITHVLAAPRELAFRAFTDPHQFAAWWGPAGNTLPSSEMKFDVRSGGYQQWTEVSDADPRIRIHVHVDLTEVIEGKLIDGLMHVGGQLPGGIEPFRTRIRFEFSDETDGRTRLTIRQWLPPQQMGNAQRGWGEALTKLDAELLTPRHHDQRSEHSNMTKLIYANNMSLDGYIEDESGKFDWFPIDEEVFTAHTDLLRHAGTFLYGRRLYEAMSVWETDPALEAQSDLTAEFVKVWKAASKVVYSTTLTDVSTGDTRIERRFDVAAVRDMKAAATSDLTIGGAHLASEAFNAGLVDECELFVLPIVVGGGKPALLPGVHAALELLDEHRFGDGVVRLRYRVT